MTQIAKNQDERLISGVASGIARYFEVSPALIRLLFLLLALVSGLGAILYFVLALLLPSESELLEQEDMLFFEKIVDGEYPDNQTSDTKHRFSPFEILSSVNVLAISCIGIGIFVLYQDIQPWSLIAEPLRLPVAILVIGLSFIVKSLHILK